MTDQAFLKAKLTISLFFLVWTVSTTAHAKIIYVDDDAVGANDGSSWIDAYNYLQDALLAAVSGDEIQIAQGIYKPDQGGGQTPRDLTASFQLKNGVILKGGYAGIGQPDPNLRDIGFYETIFSGDVYDDDDTYGVSNNSRCIVCVYGLSGFSAVLDGVTVTAGYINADHIGSYNVGAGLRIDGNPTITIVNCTFTRNYVYSSGYNKSPVCGAAIYAYYASPVISNCTFRDNHLGNLTHLAYGAALCCYYGAPVVTDCEFIENTVVGFFPSGAGIWTYEGNITVSNCTFRNNHTEGYYAYGAGLVNHHGNIVVTDCEFIENTAVSFSDSGGAGLWNNFGDIVVTACKFIKNSADYGGGLYNAIGSSTVTNCIFKDNSADRGGGIRTGGNPTVKNCLFVGNSSREGGALWNHGGSPDIVNCTFTSNTATQKGGGIWNWEGCPSIVNTIMWLNIDQDGTAEQSQIYNNSGSPLISHSMIAKDPLFLDPESGDYHLNYNSPCIDAGDPNYVPGPNETDLDDKPRIIGCRIDMGTYEYGQLVSAEARIVPHTVNLSSKGNWMTCYIWLPDQYNVADIYPNSIFLMCEIEPEQFTIDEQEQLATAVFNREDVQTVLEIGDINLKVTGWLMDGSCFEGADMIRVINKTGPK